MPAAGFSAALGAAFAAVASASTLPSFEAYVQLHQRTYKVGSDEYNERRALYAKAVQSAEEQNKKPQRLWTAGVNHLSDWTTPEFDRLLGWDGSVRPGRHSGARSISPHGTFLQQSKELPKEKVWDNLAMSRRVINQGGCGSCWAVATASVLEGHTEIYTGVQRTFSIQQIVSCTPNPRECGGTGGCQGATAELGFDWVLHNGCAEDSVVPYQATDSTCTVSGNATILATGEQQASANSFGMVGWETLPLNKYEPLVRALAERGPVAVSVSASPWGSYQSGIFDGCPKDAVIDHAVTAIGYGEENGVKYWLIQNSWSEGWGEAGHIRLQRHDESAGYCGMNNDPQKGVACKGDNDPVPVCGMCGVLFDSVVPHFEAKTMTGALAA